MSRPAGQSQRHRRSPRCPLPDKPSIAVLPFANLSEDPKQGTVTGGLTEDVITDLSRFRELFVIARNSTEVYKGKPVDVRQVADLASNTSSKATCRWTASRSA